MYKLSGYTIYGKPTCVYCYRTRQALDKLDIDYTYVEIGKDISRDDFLETFPDQKTVPMIWKDGYLIGGWEQLKDKLGIE